MTGTGALALVRELDLRAQLATTNDLRIAAAVRARVPGGARVLTADQPNHPVSMLAGRHIVMGYRGWLWTHGIDCRPLERDIRDIFDGGDDADALLRRRGITHVYIGAGEVSGWQADAGWFRTHYPTVVRLDGVEVFDVRPRPATDPLLSSRSPR
jgi:hypothetical protein